MQSLGPPHGHFAFSDPPLQTSAHHSCAVDGNGSIPPVSAQGFRSEVVVGSTLPIVRIAEDARVVLDLLGVDGRVIHAILGRRYGSQDHRLERVAEGERRKPDSAASAQHRKFFPVGLPIGRHAPVGFDKRWERTELRLSRAEFDGVCRIAGRALRSDGVHNFTPFFDSRRSFTARARSMGFMNPTTSAMRVAQITRSARDSATSTAI